MEDKKINEETLNKIYRNAHIALQSISDLLEETDDEKMKAELKDQYDGYEKIIGEISSYMAELKIEPKDINALKKGFMRSAIKLKTLADNSRTHLADMMLQGTIMGITELYTTMRSNGESVTEETRALVQKLLDFEEECESKLKSLL